MITALFNRHHFDLIKTLILFPKKHYQLALLHLHKNYVANPIFPTAHKIRSSATLLTVHSTRTSTTQRLKFDSLWRHSRYKNVTQKLHGKIARVSPYIFYSAFLILASRHLIKIQRCWYNRGRYFDGTAASDRLLNITTFGITKLRVMWPKLRLIRSSNFRARSYFVANLVDANRMQTYAWTNLTPDGLNPAWYTNVCASNFHKAPWENSDNYFGVNFNRI